MKEIKISNIQRESEKIKIKKSINYYEDLKAQLILKLGMITFDKIRKGRLIDSDFDEICEEIKKVDVEIYTRYMEIKKFESKNKRITCECGYVAFKNEKFCPQCGNNLKIEETSYTICPSCNQQTEVGSNFCSCCGNKMIKENDFCESHMYSLKKETKSNEYIIEKSTEYDPIEEVIYDVEEVDEITEINGREFLKNQENIEK